MLSIGHRGARGHAPENTIAGIEKALALGAEWIEIDVHAVEGRLVVIHDDRLERTTNGRGYVAEAAFDALRALDAGGGQRIPTLEEVFDAVGDRAGIVVELKGRGTAPLVSALLRDRFAGPWSRERVIVSSFDHRMIADVKRDDPDVRIGALIVGLPVTNAAFAAALGAYSVHPSIEFIDEEFVDDAHARGLPVYAFTANHPEDIARMQTLGVDGLFSDYPERVLSAG